MTSQTQDRAIDRSVIEQPPGISLPVNGLVLSLASVADDFDPWGRDIERRDRQLRGFWPSEPLLASALYTVIGRNSALSWSLEGGERSVKAMQRMLHSANQGKGWQDFVVKFCIDYLTQDNGCFVETVRDTDSPDGVVIGINTLDASKCRRTGMIDEPVIYTDRRGKMHLLKSHQVIDFTEFPSPIETMNGAQLCAVSRVLRAAQILKDIGVFKREKIGGRTPQSLYIASGVQQTQLDDAFADHRQEQLAQGYARYIKPLVYTTMDPTAVVSMVEIPLKSLPNGWNEDEIMRWYISQLAMGLGVDYQDLAPLPGRGIGTASQAQVLHAKSRGKGPAIFMNAIEHAFNFQGILPANVTFQWDEQDIAEDQAVAVLEKTKAETWQIHVNMGSMTPSAVQQQMLDDGLISEELFESLQTEEDLTPEIVANDDAPPTEPSANEVVGADDVPVDQKGRKDTVDGRAGFGEEVRREAEVEMEEDIAKAFARVFREARRIIQPSKRRGEFNTKQGPEDLFTDPEFRAFMRDEMISAMMPNVRRVIEASVEANEVVGVEIAFDRVNPKVLELSSRYTNAWYEALNQTTAKEVRSAITAWQETGLGNRGLPDLVKSLEPTFGTARAKRVAITETTRIFDEGNNLVHIDAGIEIEQWQTVEDGRVDDICIALNDQRFPVNGGPRPVTDTHVG